MANEDVVKALRIIWNYRVFETIAGLTYFELTKKKAIIDLSDLSDFEIKELKAACAIVDEALDIECMRELFVGCIHETTVSDEKLSFNDGLNNAIEYVKSIEVEEDGDG